MDQDPAGEGDEAGSEETGDAVTVDQAVVGYGKKQILAGLSLRVPFNKYFLQLILTNSNTDYSLTM